MNLVLPPEAADVLKLEIEQANGQEVMFVASVSEHGTISEPRAVARGNEVSVPALLPHAEKGDVVLHNHPSGMLRPSEADLAVASYLGNQGIGFLIINNLADDFYTVALPYITKATSMLSSDQLETFFLPGGSFSRQFESYEVRESQIEMLKAVICALNDNEIGVIEAGTGVGKSLAYLVPAIEWASNNDERIVISTATINLQHQLLEKDIPLAQKVLGKQVKTALVKGRGNYLCLRRLQEELDEPSLFDEEKGELQQLAAWADTTATGNKTDLSFQPSYSIWQRVCSETDTCIGLKCPFRENCFIIKARKEAASSQILIVNHHLLFSDIALRAAGIGYDNAAVLPPFQKLIFDEAHAIEKSATSFFSSGFTRNSVNRQLQRLYSQRGNRTRGLLVQLQKSMEDPVLFQDVAESAGIVKQQLDVLNERCLFLLADAPNIRIHVGNRNSLEDSLFSDLKEFRTVFVKLTARLNELLKLCGDTLDPDDEHLVETKSVYNRLDEIHSTLSAFINKAPEDEHVYWLERQNGAKGDRWITFSITPLDISAVLRESVFSMYDSVICTSATLQVNNSFEFWMSRVGLSNLTMRKVTPCFLPSPFPYDKNALLCVPANLPEPSDQFYIDSIKQELPRLLELTEGKALVLFTSYRMLQDVWNHSAGLLESQGIRVFKQGDEDRTRLLERFKADTTSVLFATDSFWEGVDSPGETLQVVVICRLPFKVPSDPILQARMEAIDHRGGNSFMELSIPEAVMKFKQGFGRLMRKNTDKGIVVIYDTRIVKKRYGHYFINSLPKTLVSIKDNEQMLQDIEDFLY